ncbi:MAG: DUF4058 family protein [Planctomycetia bacterium]|nr:DUF4058 family protein [Planctomycetia bacterium]
MRATRDRAPTRFALVAAADEVGQAARSGDRACGVWPIRLRDGLPSIPVPLRAPDPDARLDLQAVLHTIYDRRLPTSNLSRNSQAKAGCR